MEGWAAEALWWTAWFLGGKDAHRGRAPHRGKRNDASLYQMPPRAWRPGLEPAELSFRVPHFFHQTRRGFRRVEKIHHADSPGNQKMIELPKVVFEQ
jgi:hypothetical protein